MKKMFLLFVLVLIVSACSQLQDDDDMMNDVHDDAMDDMMK